MYNLSNFVIPDDSEFLAVIESLDTPEKACEYTMENFEWESYLLNYSPYQVWLANTKASTGDCNDIACFLAFITHYHGYEVYRIVIQFRGTFIGHALCVFVEEGQYTYSSNQYYHPIYVNTFDEIVGNYFTYQWRELQSYRVYDYNNKLIEKGTNE